MEVRPSVPTGDVLVGRCVCFSRWQQTQQKPTSPLTASPSGDHRQACTLAADEENVSVFLQDHHLLHINKQLGFCVDFDQNLPKTSVHNILILLLEIFHILLPNVLNKRIHESL